MIVVIADDFTGAAELGGLALRYNLRVKITSEVPLISEVDVMVIASDSRSMSEADARKTVALTCHQLSGLKPSFVYKKIDSVLRGHILAEIDEQRKFNGYKKVLIIPGNPALGRTIENGSYLIHQQLIHETSFHDDPEFPILSSDVAAMLRAKDGQVKTKVPAGPIPENAVIVGDVKNKKDLEAWSSVVDNETLVAGAAEFFDAMLKQMGFEKNKTPTAVVPLHLPALMVFGSAFRHQKNMVLAHVEKEQICYVPETILDANWYQQQARTVWIDKIAAQLNKYGKALITTPAIKLNDPVLLRTRIAEACAVVNNLVHINEWLIEGGATAASILHELNIKKLYPLQELAPGVIRMGVIPGGQLHFTLKPGSYDWPESILSLTKQQQLYGANKMIT